MKVCSAPKMSRRRASSDFGFLAVAVLERLADAAGEAAGQGDEALGALREQLPVDARLVVVALEVGGRGELDEVGVAVVLLGEESQVVVALLLEATVVAHVHLTAENRLDSVLSGLSVELDGSGQRAVVGERNGRHLELGRPGGELWDPARSVEDRVFGVDVEVNERGFGHAEAHLRTRS